MTESVYFASLPYTITHNVSYKISALCIFTRIASIIISQLFASNHLEALLKKKIILSDWAPLSEFLIQKSEFTFQTSSQVILMLV